MDPMCISLVHQYLDSTNSSLANQFKNKYQPKKTNVQLREVLSKWKEEQLVRGLIYQYLTTVDPSLALEFWNRHRCSLDTAPQHLIGEIQKKLATITNSKGISKVEDESGVKQKKSNDKEKKTFTAKELEKGLVYQHLETVAPGLAVEFKNTHLCCSETALKHLTRDIEKKV